MESGTIIFKSFFDEHEFLPVKRVESETWLFVITAKLQVGNSNQARSQKLQQITSKSQH